MTCTPQCARICIGQRRDRLRGRQCCAHPVGPAGRARLCGALLCPLKATLGTVARLSDLTALFAQSDQPWRNSSTAGRSKPIMPPIRRPIRRNESLLQKVDVKSKNVFTGLLDDGASLPLRLCLWTLRMATDPVGTIALSRGSVTAALHCTTLHCTHCTHCTARTPELPAFPHASIEACTTDPNAPHRANHDRRAPMHTCMYPQVRVLKGGLRDS